MCAQTGPHTFDFLPTFAATTYEQGNIDVACLFTPGNMKYPTGGWADWMQVGMLLIQSSSDFSLNCMRCLQAKIAATNAVLPPLGQLPSFYEILVSAEGQYSRNPMAYVPFI